MTYFKTIAAGAFCVLGAFAAQAQDKFSDMPAGEFLMDLSHTSLIWRVNHAGLSMYTARFTEMSGTLDLVPDDPAASSVSIKIDPMSAETDFPLEYTDWNATLRTGPDFFQAGEFPSITFVSDSIEVTGENTAIMTGTVELLGVKKIVPLDVTFNGAMAENPFTKKPTIGFSARGELQRSAFGMDAFIPFIGDTVELQIEVEFAKES